jgi:gliding motility-associated-like protein
MNWGFRTILTLAVALSAIPVSRASVFYVDAVQGDDAYNGSVANFVSGLDGPKKTINAAMQLLAAGDTLYIAKGTYLESIKVNQTQVWETSDTVLIKSLYMQASGGELVLQGNMLYVRDSLQMDVGLITVNSGFVFSTKEYANVNIGSDSSYVNGRYFLENSNPFIGNLIFPVGRGNSYRPVVMNILQSTYDLNRYGFELKIGPPPAGTLPPTLGNLSQVHHLEFSSSGLADPYDVVAYMAYDTAGLDDEVYDIDSVHVAFLPSGSGAYKDLQGLGTAPQKGNISNSTAADTTGIFVLATAPHGLNPLGHPEPIARFRKVEACANSPMQFTNESRDFKDSIAYQRWDFGTGNPADTSNQISPAFTYSTAGSYRVVLKIRNRLNLEDSIERFVTVHPLPKALFTPDTVCPGQTASFISKSTISGGTILRTAWDFGDGNIDTGKSVSHTYAAPGKYGVTLVVRSARCFSIFTDTVLVLSEPNPFFRVADYCLNDTVRFNGNGSTPADSVKYWLWSVEGSTPDTGRTSFYLPPLPGTYKASLRVITARGCTGTARDTFLVFPEASPALSVNNACQDKVISFTGNGGSAGDTIRSWNWEVNGAPAASMRSFQSSFSSSGRYGVKLSVTSQGGCRDSVTDTFMVYRRPIPSFYLNPALSRNDSVQCSTGNLFTLVNASRSADTQTLASSLWFWDNSAVAGTNTFSKSTSGVLKATLVVQSSQGCSDSFSRNYLVQPRPSLRWGHLNNCLPTPIVFNDLTDYTGITLNERQWQFGDGNVRFGATPSVQHLYVNPGTYAIKLITTTSGSCRDTLEKTLTFGRLPSIDITPLGNLPFCAGDSILLTVTGGDSMRWFDGNRTSSRYFSKPGYKKAITFGSPLCFSEDSFLVSVFARPAVNAGKDTFMYRGKPIVLFGSGGVNFRWEPATYCRTPNAPGTEVNPPTDTFFILSVSDGNACRASDTVRVRVLDLPPPVVTFIPNMITPNDDRSNDVWDLQAVPEANDCTIDIYNQWGGLVYSFSGAYGQNWAGTATNGNPLPQGTYMYIIKGNSNNKEYKGYLHIQRQ